MNTKRNESKSVTDEEVKSILKKIIDIVETTESKEDIIKKVEVMMK
ncbi:MAG: hypothetical protein Q4G11_05595 [Gallicola sp.]|nr:hypothetical protein [Gallicola sp.]